MASPSGTFSASSIAKSRKVDRDESVYKWRFSPWTLALALVLPLVFLRFAPEESSSRAPLEVSVEDKDSIVEQILREEQNPAMNHRATPGIRPEWSDKTGVGRIEVVDQAIDEASIIDEIMQEEMNNPRATHGARPEWSKKTGVGRKENIWARSRGTENQGVKEHTQLDWYRKLDMMMMVDIGVNIFMVAFLLWGISNLAYLLVR